MRVHGARRAGLAAAVALALSASGARALACAHAAEPGPRLTLSVVPNLPPILLHKAWAPFVERIARDTGIQLDLRLHDNFTSFLDASAAGVPDLLFTSPNMLVVTRRSQPYVPLVRAARPVTGIVFVRKDSPYRTVADLRGKTIAFAGNRSLCAVITRHAMLTAGERVDYNAAFGGSAVNVAKMVVLGKADAGATLGVSLPRDAPETMDQVRIILETPPVAAQPLAAHPRVPAEIRERIAAAVVALGTSEEGRALLDAVRLADPVRASYARDYRTFEEMPSEQPAAADR